jgi:DhnA family fructose-bisphosphate aldolase class Ia
MDSELYQPTDETLFSERVVAFALDHGVDLDAEMLTEQDAPEADLATVTALVGSILVQP